MVTPARGLWLATMLSVLGLAGTAAAQGLLPPPGAAPDPSLQGPGPSITRPGGIAVTPVVPVPPPNPIPVIPAPPVAPPFPPPPAVPYPPPPGPATPPYGMPASPYGPKAEPQFFFDWELQFLAPTVSNHLQNSIPLPGGGTFPVAIAGADLDLTLAPRLEVGYRLADNAGQLSFAYRFIASQGSEGQSIDGANFDVTSRLNLEEFSFDYATAAFSPAPHWNLQGWIGGRVDTIFYDTRATNAVANLHESNYFVGAGPHLGGQAEYQLPLASFSLFGRVDGGALIGEDQQKFSANSPAFEPARKSLTVETIQVQFGVGYTPPSLDWLHFRVGYQFEQWFNLGNIQNSHLNLTTQGGFLGGEINF